MRKHLWYFSLFRFSPSFWQDLQVFSIKKLNISRFQFFYVDRSVSDQIKFTQISELCDIACNCSHKKRKKKSFRFLWLCCNSFQCLICIGYVCLVFSLVSEAVIPVNIDWMSLVIAFPHHSFGTYINTFSIAI